ncbi:MAG: DUF2332 domain-containing protein [Actinobacteria bacterium]|nr:DUF2332 domain-containing protein [Actinomycetota bacterium]
MGRAMSLSGAYRHFGQTDAGASSPLYESVAVAIADSPDALAVVEQAPPLKRHPTVILAALHDQVLRGNAPELAAAFAARDGAAAAVAAVDALVDLADDIVATATLRQTQTNETGRCAVLYPAIAEGARRVGASRVALIDVGCSAGLNLTLDRCAIHYDDGESLGDPDSLLQLHCARVGPNAVPATALAEVVARIGIDLNPVDVNDEDDARWLHACLWPDQPERTERLNAAIQLSSQTPPTLLQGDALARLPDALAMVPSDVLPVITTTWALAYFSLEDRLRFLRRLDEFAAQHPLVWVSAEGVDIAPAVPTMGDSRLAGHSLVGLAVLAGSRVQVEMVGRCHPHGRWLEWTS